MPPPLCGDGRIKTTNQIKCLDGGDKPAATPHIGREQRELVLGPSFAHFASNAARLLNPSVALCPLLVIATRNVAAPRMTRSPISDIALRLKWKRPPKLAELMNLLSF